MNSVDFLYEMVKTPSLSTHEYLVAGILRKRMKELGISAHIDKAGNVVSVSDGIENSINREQGSRLENKKTECDLLIFSHMDVVYPILPNNKNDKTIYGRGAVDAKGPLCALLEAYAQVKDQLNYNVVFAGVTEEEATTSNGIKHLLTYVKPRMSLLGEPSNLNGITIAYKGRILAKVSVHGTHSHASNPKDNPIDKLVEYYYKIKGQFPITTPFKSITITPTFINFGTKEALNVVPDQGELILDIRFPPAIEIDNIKKILTDDKNVNVEFEEYLPGAENNINNQLVKSLMKGIRSQNLEPRFVKKTGSCDMNYLVPKGIITIAYGPGDSNLDHMDDEHILIEDYLKSIEIIKETLLNLKF